MLMVEVERDGTTYKVYPSDKTPNGLLKAAWTGLGQSKYCFKVSETEWYWTNDLNRKGKNHYMTDVFSVQTKRRGIAEMLVPEEML